MPDAVANPSTIDRLRGIMRRDLKLGPDAELPADLPLAGGEFDLDSLDLLMLVTSIEKEFGVRITEGSMGRDTFRSLDTLARFVDNARAAGSEG